jgi:exosortase E/protease (VPEID-CTERM system)
MLATKAFVGLLVAEVLYLTVKLDSEHLDRLPSGWAALADWPAQFLRLAITIGFVTIAFGGRALWDTWGSQLRAGERALVDRGASLIIHFGFLASFARISSILFEGAGDVQPAPALWVSLWLLAALVTLLAWGHALLPLSRWGVVLNEQRATFASGAMIGLVACTLGFASESFWAPFARQTFAILAMILGVVYQDVVSDPSTLTVGTSAFTVQIAPGCSGYEGVGLVLVVLTVYLFLFRRELRFPAALTLLPLGAFCIWVLNFARIVALIAIGDAGWQDVAAGGFHSQAGWLCFNAVSLGFVALTRKVGAFSKAADAEPAPDTDQGRTDFTSPYLAPFLALLAAAMITGALSAGFDWLYPSRLVVLAAVFWAFRGSYAVLNWSVSWIGFAYGVAAFAIWIALLPEGASAKASWPVALESVGSGWALAWLVARTIGYVIAVPVAEELAFRAYLTRRFWRPNADALPIGTFTWGAFLLSSLIFGAFHGQRWLAGTLAGMLFALAFYRRGSIGNAVLAHATTNGLLAAYVFATGHWSAWS